MAKQDKAPALKVQKDPEDTIGIVQGQMPDSRNEWFVALALDKLGIEYYFQVSLNGGTSIRGGQVIDFVVFRPNPTPVFIQGEYWHNQAQQNEDILKQRAAEETYKTKPIILMGEETDTKDKAYKTVIREIGT